MTATAPLVAREQLFVGGQWIDPAGEGTIAVVNAATEEVMGHVPAGGPADVDRAVGAARTALPIWSGVPAHERAEACAAIGAGLAARQEELAVLIASELGMPVRQAALVQVGLAVMDFSSQPGLVDQIAWEEEIGNSLVVREPVGVVGAITPWNYPLHQISAKVAAALSAGCTIVLKPSEVTPLNAFVLAEVVEAIGLPPGVLNLVTGDGPTVGEAIVAHPGVDMVSFTGSTRAGRRIGAVAAEGVKRVSLELGGKSPNVILADADLERAVVDGVQKCFLNSGQTCSALTRMIVPREHLPVVEEIARAAAEAMPVGDPFAADAVLGPLVSDAQRERVRGFIAQAQEEGARLVVGGAEPPEGVDRGFYVRPTVFSDVTPEMTIAQEEVFGPVLAIMPAEDEDDAVRLANATVYGLAGGVWAGDEDHAVAVARRLRTGQVEVNGGVFNPLAPFGGYGQSGHGRELGRLGVEEFLQVKSLQR